MSRRRRRCPGHPNRVLPSNRVSCADCWRTLPTHLQRAVTATLGKPTSRSKAAIWNDVAAYLGRTH